ncbi:MAG: ATP-binding protein [Candidatus Thorarchaeota archaeon]
MAKATVDISLSLSGAIAVIEILDDGPGVSEDLRSRLFHRGSSRNGGGLGFYLSRQLLGVYDGTIELLASRKGE